MANHYNNIIALHRERVSKIKIALSKPFIIIVQILAAAGAAWTISGFKQSYIALVYVLLTPIAFLILSKIFIKILDNYLIFVNINKLVGSLNCPFYSKLSTILERTTSDDNICPLGLIDIKESARETLQSLLKTKKEYYFLGFGSENIFMKIKESDEVKKFQEFIDSHRDSPISLSFIIRDPEDKELVKQLESLRYKNHELKEGEIYRELTNAQTLHDLYRNDFHWPITTYISNKLENFRILIIDELAYISCNVIGKSHLSVPQLIFKKSDSTMNFYNWFLSYIKHAVMDVERRGEDYIKRPN